ncbi:MAG: hypothetical protein E7323_01475 [Clostridiales bacterium]|nr:hypothetical protein [Clostridiales bacterium]
MEASFELFGLTGYRLGLWAAIGTLVLFGVMLLLAKGRRVQPSAICVLTLSGAVLGIVFARLLYCLVNLSDFIDAYENLWLTLRFFDGGLSLSGLLIGLLLAVPVTAAITREKAAELLDILCVPVGLLLCALYLGQQDTGLGIGKVVEEGALTNGMPWLFLCERMGVNVEYRMLVYLYQAILSGVLAAVMLLVYLRAQKNPGFRSGETAWLSLAIYGAAMVVMESLRDDGHMQMIFLRIGQVTSALLPIIAMVLLSKRHCQLAGKATGKTIFGWVAVLLLVGGIVVLEFALDGRLASGDLTAGHFYLCMVVLCALVAVAVGLLYAAVMKKRATAVQLS